jgi:hypothetical protein
MTGARVEHVDEQGVIVAGELIKSATVLWTAGIAPSPILSMLGVDTDHAGRVCVSPFLDLPDKPQYSSLRRLITLSCPRFRQESDDGAHGCNPSGGGTDHRLH